MKKVTILMIGLGRIGGKFYEEFTKLDTSRVEIIGISEPNLENPLVQDAEARGIPNFLEFEDAVHQYGEKIDIIMDTSNRKDLKLAARKLLQETENKHTVVVPMIVDYLMWYLLPDAEDLQQSHHEDIGY